MTMEAILNYWFGADSDDAAVVKQKSALWWSKSREIDEDIRQRFESWMMKASAGELSQWQSTPSGLLALILLTDQFPRNVYRDSPRAFAQDSKALACCLEGLDVGCDIELRPIERVFFYLPLEHAESLECQNRSVALFRRLAQSVPSEQKPVFQEYLDYAVRHRDVIARFGRFPHRNRILGRETTTEETTFLAEPGSSF